MICPNCKAEIPDGRSMCPQCGALLTDASASMSSQAAASPFGGGAMDSSFGGGAPAGGDTSPFGSFGSAPQANNSFGMAGAGAQAPNPDFNATAKKTKNKSGKGLPLPKPLILLIVIVVVFGAVFLALKTLKSKQTPRVPQNPGSDTTLEDSSQTPYDPFAETLPTIPADDPGVLLPGDVADISSLPTAIQTIMSGSFSANGTLNGSNISLVISGGTGAISYDMSGKTILNIYDGNTVYYKNVSARAYCEIPKGSAAETVKTLTNITKAVASLKSAPGTPVIYTATDGSTVYTFGVPDSAAGDRVVFEVTSTGVLTQMFIGGPSYDSGVSFNFSGIPADMPSGDADAVFSIDGCTAVASLPELLKS